MTLYLAFKLPSTEVRVKSLQDFKLFSMSHVGGAVDGKIQLFLTLAIDGNRQLPSRPGPGPGDQSPTLDIPHVEGWVARRESV